MDENKRKAKAFSSKRMGRLLLEIVTIVLFLLFMFPFGMVVLNSAKTSREIIFNAIALPSDWGQLFTNVSLIFNNPTVDYLGAFLDSALISFFSLIVICLFSSMCAWVLVRNNTTWSKVLFMAFVSAMVIPFQVLMYPLVRWMWVVGEALHVRLLGTIPGIVFAYLGFGSPLSIFVFHGFIKNIPYELEEAATIDGCSRGRTFFEIVFPLLQPIIVTVLILNGIWIWTRIEWHSPDDTDRSHCLCRCLSEAVGFDSDFDAYSHASCDHPVPVLATLHHQRNAGRFDKMTRGNT